jgi:nucleotide-binding universal stress UspA family protein
MINTIVVPIDGSDHANRAIEIAGDIAAKFDAKVIIVQALLHGASISEIRDLYGPEGDPEVLKEIETLEDVMLSAVSADMATVPVPIPSEILRRVGDKISQRAKEICEGKGAKFVSTLVVDGKPADNVVAIAEHEKADLIVMGRRGLGNISGLLMGSVSHKVSHLAECACMTVK